MRIQHNIAALNSYRNLTNNNSAVSKNLEKLSSGYKINRAGDDAAGLAISEKMRAQITGLETAQKNANDGISLVQTAEGALTEVHSMLNRMLELANQSANGTYQNAVDRENLQKELTALQDEIDRVADATNFNGIYVLNGMQGAESEGTVGSTAAQISGNLGNAGVTETTQGAAGTAAAVYDFDVSGLTFESDGNVKLTVGNYSVDVAVTAGMSTTDFASAAETAINNAKWGESADTGVLTAQATGSGIKLTAANQAVDASSGLAGGGTIKVEPAEADGAATGATATYEATIDGADGALANGDSITIGGKTYNIVTASATGDQIGLDTASTFEDQINAAITKYNGEAGEAWTAAYADGKITFTAKDGQNPTGAPAFSISDAADAITAGTPTEVTAAGPESGSLILQVGDSKESYNQITVTVSNMHSANLGVSKADINISTQTDALDAIQKIKDAINSVSSTRGDLGAIQNRLEHTINNLSVTTENMTAAESRIRDTDMAEEMMAYTKNNILVQASQAMLAQANQIPQGVLQLLQ